MMGRWRVVLFLVGLGGSVVAPSSASAINTAASPESVIGLRCCELVLMARLWSAVAGGFSRPA